MLDLFLEEKSRVLFKSAKASGEFAGNKFCHMWPFFYNFNDLQWSVVYLKGISMWEMFWWLH